MLSYRHGYHAGNHADILKHMTLCLILRSLNKKEKPYFVLDTHSGAGLYKLNSVFASKNKEYKTGISKISANEKLRKLVPEFYEVYDFLQQGEEEQYPGSPYISAALTRECDKLTFVDMHVGEIDSLTNLFKRDRRVNILKTDGFDSLKALLPPPIRRGLCVIDPSYEIKNDYLHLVKALKQGLTRWSTGIYAIWYPILGKQNDHSKNLIQDIKRLNVPLLNVSLQVNKQDDVLGMCGSGMLILNYPYNLYNELEDILGELYSCLKMDDSACAKLNILNEKT